MSQTTKLQKIVIIGNGISGITAARHIRKRSQDEILVISRETEYFFSRTALMYVYMGHMRYKDIKPYEDWFWDKNRIGLKRAEVTQINFGDQTLELRNLNGKMESNGSETIKYDVLIIATGSDSNKFGWPGQDLVNVQGMYSWQDLENLEQISPDIEHGVVVGGGLIGIELAEMLHSRNKKVSLIVREENYWDNVLPSDEAKMVNEQILRNHINLYLNTELDEIIGDEKGKVTAIRTKDGNRLPCQFVGLTAGVHPNIKWLTDESPIETDKGILVDEYLQTNIKNVYAIGDCAELRDPPSGRKPIEAVWYVGRIMGETVAHTVTGHRTRYNPGPWFNSAKFIDLEYQVYGLVPNKIEAPNDSFYWQHQNEDVAIRLVYNEESRRISGINVLGTRWKMDVCMDWLRNGVKVDKVVDQMEKAHFDPEFHNRYYDEIRSQFPANQNNSN